MYNEKERQTQLHSVSCQNLDILTMKIQCSKMPVITDKRNVHEMSMRVKLSDTQYYY